MVEDKIASLTVSLRYKPGYTGILVGQCKEFPFIIVEGKTEQELKDNIYHELTIYFETFPNEGKRILEQYGRTVSVETNQMNENEKKEWTQKEIKIPAILK